MNISSETNSDDTDNNVKHLLAELEQLSIDELASQWQTLTGRPAHRQNKRALNKQIAYVVQEAAWGGLASDTISRLEAVYYQSSRDSLALPTMGSSIIREWRGRTYRITVLPQGFEYGGRFYTSLSAIAREITGTRISGPAFFHLKGNAR